MKKRAYIQPYARQVILDAEQMVANTPQVTFDDGTPPINYGGEKDDEDDEEEWGNTKGDQGLWGDMW